MESAGDSERLGNEGTGATALLVCLRLLYLIAVSLALPLTILWFAIAALLGFKRYRLVGMRERLGWGVPLMSAPGQSVIWVHCVSVGEVLAARPLVHEIRRRQPGAAVCISTVTASGRDIARQELGQLPIFYAPFDHPLCVKSALRRVRPNMLLLVETELWPSLITLAHRAGVRTAIVNGRISDRSYPRYLRLRGFFAPLLGSMDLFLMQSREDQNRIANLGADIRKVDVLPNLKWQPIETRPEEAGTWKRALGIGAESEVLVAGSTCAGEEEIILDAVESVRQRFPGLVTIIAPRKPHRFDEVRRMLAARGVNWVARSSGGSGAPFILLDTLGELSRVYSVADVAFVGGSLVRVGGHNPLEPAAWAKPVLFGIYMGNFREISRLLVEGGAARSIETLEELSQWLIRLLSNSQEAERMGEAGVRVIREFAETAGRAVDALAPLLCARPAPRKG